MDLLHISDTHFGTEREEVIDALLALHRKTAAGAIVLSGDVTQRATRAQFAAASRFMARLPSAEFLAIPGNHDIPLFNLYSRLTTPFERYSRCFGDELEPVVDTPSLLIIGVNTVCPRRHKNGALSRTQIARVATRLTRAHRAQLRVVVTHHPLEVTRPEDESNRARRGAQAIQQWVAAGADLVLGGHIHLPFLMPVASRAPLTERNAWLLQAGTAVSARVRGEASNSVNLVLRHRFESRPAAQRQCTVQRWDFDESHLHFLLASEATLHFDATGNPP